MPINPKQLFHEPPHFEHSAPERVVYKKKLMNHHGPSLTVRENKDRNTLTRIGSQSDAQPLGQADTQRQAAPAA